MPASWREIFKRQDEYAKQKVEQAQDAHADPKVLLAESIRQLQDDHDKLEHACAVVLGQAAQAKQRLETDTAKEHQLDSTGRAAMAAGHAEAAQAIAHQLTLVREMLATEQPSYDKIRVAADQAQAAFRANSDQLKAKLEEAKQLAAEIDQAAVEHNIQESMNAVNSLTAHTIPSFDQVRDRIHAEKAQADAETTLTGSGPDLTAVNDQHLIQQAAADDVLASWGSPSSGAPSPGAPSPGVPAPPRPVPHPTSGGSPMDQFNS